MYEKKKCCLVILHILLLSGKILYKNTGRIIFVLLFLFHLSEGLNFVLNCQIIPNFTFFCDKIQLIKIPSGCQSSHCGMPQNVVKTLNSSEPESQGAFHSALWPIAFYGLCPGILCCFRCPWKFLRWDQRFQLSLEQSLHPPWSSFLKNVQGRGNRGALPPSGKALSGCFLMRNPCHGSAFLG